MSKSKSHDKDKKKSAQLVLRVERSERDAFLKLCEAADTTAAREIRRFMRDYVARKAPSDVNQVPAVAEEGTVDAAQEPESTVAVDANPAASKSRKKAARAA